MKKVLYYLSAAAAATAAIGTSYYLYDISKDDKGDCSLKYIITLIRS